MTNYELAIPKYYQLIVIPVFASLAKRLESNAEFYCHPATILPYTWNFTSYGINGYAGSEE